MNTKDNPRVIVCANREDMGKQSSLSVANKIRELLAQQPTVNIIFAAAPSQNEFLAALAKEELEWDRINAFHMDEYIGLEEYAPQRFGNFLKQRLFDKVRFGNVMYIDGNATDSKQECLRYASLLDLFIPDIVCMGIGENGHLAFNDPPVANFQDPEKVKIVTLEKVCRQQQVNDGCFATINDVPKNAITLTIPVLMKARHVFCMVPGKLKTAAVYNTLNQPIVHQYPSTILRTHPSAILFLDQESSGHV